ncbi:MULTISPECIES: protein TolR [Sphingomonadales]|uniref:Protein TolR n=2 Tax=Edaphosphingomonas TaxID=3423724 RepID=A0A2T4I7I0_9SPHN|nr:MULTISPECIES: protein TolR [Sphingomonas]AGH50119.1 biopolymer transport protein TolR [Sphingomonas sp. MM-1]MDX3883019.1 protein TolR [Sphingomonas sp.]OHT18478.1 Biopolymer transport protein ExbD [Sphingomonas haloaromaticamans]PTD27155.1 protein TolR [Sphingomonas fennica]
MGMGPVQGRGPGGRRAPMAEINVTPLVDVMLVLLIIFMIAAPLMATGVPVNLPDSRAGALDQKDQPIMISIDGTGKVFLDDQEVLESTLAARLGDIAATRGHGKDAPQIFLRADRGLDYGRVMRVMGELNRAGLNKVALVTAGEDRS